MITLCFLPFLPPSFYLYYSILFPTHLLVSFSHLFLPLCVLLYYLYMFFSLPPSFPPLVNSSCSKEAKREEDGSSRRRQLTRNVPSPIIFLCLLSDSTFCAPARTLQYV